MNLHLSQRMQGTAPLSRDDADALLRAARALGQAAVAGHGPLSDAHIALCCGDAALASAREIEAAATALGARVSRLRPEGLLRNGRLIGGKGTARLLASLYDAFECDALAPDAAARLQRELGRPVFNGLTRADHPLSSLQAEMCGEDTPERCRSLLLQALLVHTIRS